MAPVPLILRTSASCSQHVPQVETSGDQVRRLDLLFQLLGAGGPRARIALSHPFFGWEGSPTKIDVLKKLVPAYSILSTGGPSACVV